MSRLALRLRRARLADRAVLEGWDEAPDAAGWSGHDDSDWDEELRRNPPWRRILIAELWGRPLGCVEIIDPAREESRYWGAVPGGLRAIDIWIGDPADRGRRHGARMMRLALALCWREGARAVLIDPLRRNRRAIRFYGRMGFRVAGPRRFGRDACLVMRAKRPCGPGCGRAAEISRRREIG
jgi:aminoglycoside 6'-N-acetyltransferase